MKKDDQEAGRLSVLERMKEIEIENKFFHTLADIGFEVKRSVFHVLGQDLHFIKHYALPISCSFNCDLKLMMITYMSAEPWSWITHKEAGKPFMTCDSFIRWHIGRVREMTKEILIKLES
jgi:hypothetical protein